MLLQLRLTWLWISLRAGVEPVRLGRLLLLLHLQHLQQLVLLILGPCSAVQHGHSDSSAAEQQQQPQQQQRVRRFSLPQLPVLLPVQHARAGKLQRAGVSQLHLRQVCSHFLPVLSLSTHVRSSFNPSLRRGIDFLFHSFGCINDEENVCTPPKLGRYLKIYPSRP